MQLQQLPRVVVRERAERPILETMAHVELRLGFGQFGVVSAHFIPTVVVLLIFLSQHFLSLEGRLRLGCVPATPRGIRGCFPIEVVHAVTFESFHCA